MRLFKKRPDPYEDAAEELQNLRKMLQEQGEYDSKCRYLEIVAKRLLFFESSLDVVRFLLSVLVGFCAAFLLNRILMGL